MIAMLAEVNYQGRLSALFDNRWPFGGQVTAACLIATLMSPVSTKTWSGLFCILLF